jgi:hypothetical protein
LSLWQGKRQEARGKSEEGLGDFTFLYTVWFYCVHLLMGKPGTIISISCIIRKVSVKAMTIF